MTCKLTIDTNLMEVEPHIPAMDTLKHWKEEGKIELIEADPPRVARTPTYGWPGAPPKTALEKKSSWGDPKGRPKKINESGKANFKTVASVLFPGKDPMKLNLTEINHIAHLIKHHSRKNEIFVTANIRDFIEGGRRELLKAYFGIITMTPEETVNMLRELHKWNAVRKGARAGQKEKL